ncbi:hypothetical protein FB107DRAFT_224995, partial [Schizophyllum commune]
YRHHATPRLIIPDRAPSIDTERTFVFGYRSHDALTHCTAASLLVVSGAFGIDAQG